MTVQVPKRKALSTTTTTNPDKPPPVPKKYVPFSIGDSSEIEAAFQQLADSEEREKERLLRIEDSGDIGDTKPKLYSPVKVPVNEDYLFDVDVECRELAPAYWLGPAYDVRRGTWFYQGMSLFFGI
jgi:hypothetical protein